MQKVSLRKRIGIYIAVLGSVLTATTGASAAFAAPAEAAAQFNNCRTLDAGAGYTFAGTVYRYAAYCDVRCSFGDWIFGCRNGWQIVNYAHDPNTLKRLYRY